jgi:hypothetical protein
MQHYDPADMIRALGALTEASSHRQFRVLFGTMAGLWSVAWSTA